MLRFYLCSRPSFSTPWGSHATCVPLLWGMACCLWLAPFRDVLKCGTEQGNRGNCSIAGSECTRRKLNKAENVPATLKLTVHIKKLQFYTETIERIQTKHNTRSEKLSLLLGSKDDEQKWLQKSASCTDMSEHTARSRGRPGATFPRSQPKALEVQGCLFSLHHLGETFLLHF